MLYTSTRSNSEKVTAATAIARGMVPQGGLYVPEELPKYTAAEVEAVCQLPTYQDIAKKILGDYLQDYTAEEIAQCIAEAYHDNFDTKTIAPIVKLKDQNYILELWHGPTAAFKDMALQLTPRLLVRAMEKTNVQKEVVILVATSGDTGKAALEGFKNVPGTKIIVFYPANGVSKIQELQMVTTDGDNTFVVAVDGNFDDCQGAVKEMFADQALIAELDAAGYQFSSANSINWGRLLPQIVYYFGAYAQLIQKKEIAFGERMDVTVPTGNFGNILAAYYAQQMGLPVGKLVCASNQNNVLTDFIRTGTYDKRRTFYQTNSPSMDILVSSNLERFLFALTNQNGEQVAEWMQQLQTQGFFTVDADTKAKMDAIITGDFADEQETVAEIRDNYTKYQYLLDTHTAIAVKAANSYRAQSGSKNAMIIDSTAHPGKFAGSVFNALQTNEKGLDDLALLEELKVVANMTPHPGLADLGNRPILHQNHCARETMPAMVKKLLGV